MTYTEERDAAAMKHFRENEAEDNLAASSRIEPRFSGFCYGADWQRTRAKKLVEALKAVKNRMASRNIQCDKDEAELIFTFCCEALKEYGDEDAKYPLTTKKRKKYETNNRTNRNGLP